MVRPRIVVAEGAIGLNKPNRHCNFTSQSRGSVRFGEKAPHPSSRIGRQEPNAGCGANKVRGWEGTRTNGQCPIGAAGNYVGPVGMTGQYHWEWTTPRPTGRRPGDQSPPE